ncbi:MAG: hypothetical protein HC896_05510 [Bacteroidales bacterium]|nr:hypothetical protein [Bacteroidales bacterium]
MAKLYTGNKNVEIINEDDWYKYSIGDFDAYAEAEAFKNKLNIKDAFVVAYRDAKRVSLASGTALPGGAQAAMEQHAGTKPADLVSSLIFVVQVAASKQPLDKQVLKVVYTGQQEIQTREEEGWYKYQIGHTPSYDQARQTLITSKVPGSFIVAYQNNQKQLLWKAIEQYNQSGGIVFYVQICASKTVLTRATIATLYNGSLTVREIKEDDWFKYQILAGNTYDDARRLKNLIHVNGAFVVPYKNDVKLSLKQAIEITKQIK